MIIGKAILQARRDATLSQAALAEKAGVSRQAVVGIEADRGSLAVLTALATVLEFKLSGVASGSTIVEQLRNGRAKRGWSQDELASRAGLSVPTIRGLEAGRGHVASLNRVLAAIAPSARLRAKPRAHWSPHTRDTRFTPPALLDQIVKSFGPICLDPCAHEASFVEAQRVIAEAECGLTSSWAGSKLVFCNPPFSQLVRWIERCHRAWASGEAKTVFGLFPARSDSATYHDRVFGVADILQMRGRIRFFGANGKLDQAPFPIMFCIWGADPAALETFKTAVPSAHIPRGIGA